MRTTAGTHWREHAAELRVRDAAGSAGGERVGDPYAGRVECSRTSRWTTGPGRARWRSAKPHRLARGRAALAPPRSRFWNSPRRSCLARLARPRRGSPRATRRRWCGAAPPATYTLSYDPSGAGRVVKGVGNTGPYTASNLTPGRSFAAYSRS